MARLERRGGPPDSGRLPTGEFSEDAGVVRAMYLALEGRDPTALALSVDPEIAFVDPAVTLLPFDGLRHGLPAVLRAAFHRDSSAAGPEVSGETFLELGDGVLVAGRLLWPRGARDEPDERPFLHECFVRGGRVALIRGYPA
jgi:hypothetical protein